MQIAVRHSTNRSQSMKCKSTETLTMSKISHDNVRRKMNMFAVTLATVAVAFRRGDKFGKRIAEVLAQLEELKGNREK